METLNMRAATAEEKKYACPQSRQIMGITGCVGRFEVSLTDGFHMDWKDEFKALKDGQFLDQLTEAMEALRSDPEYDHILRDKESVQDWCGKHPDAAIKGPSGEYGLRLDLDGYICMIRMQPERDILNANGYCYKKGLLEDHILQARQGIRFITPHYEEKFRAEDGDTIRIITKNGEQRNRVCRFVDEYHMELSSNGTSNLYHIAEFADRFQESGCRDVFPLRESLPDKCFSSLVTTNELITITKGERGYQPVHVRGEGMTLRESVDVLNDTMGVNRAQEAAMLAGSMFGWGVPAADPRNYNEKGIAIRHRERNRGEAR